MRISDWSSDVCSSDLHGDMPLIVVLRNDKVEGALVRAVIDGVGRNRPDDAQAFILGHSHAGYDLQVVLAPEQSVLAAVRIDAGDGDPRLFDTHPNEEIGRASCRERVCQYV